MKEMDCSITVRLSSKHKRVLFVKDEMEAHAIFRALNKAQRFFDGGEEGNSKAVRYQVMKEGLLGEGSFGKVYKALDT